MRKRGREDKGPRKEMVPPHLSTSPLPCRLQSRDSRKPHWARYLIEGALEQRGGELSSVPAPPPCVTFGKSPPLSGPS